MATTSNFGDQSADNGWWEKTIDFVVDVGSSLFGRDPMRNQYPWISLKPPLDVMRIVLQSLTASERARLDAAYAKANRGRKIPEDNMQEFRSRIYDHTGNTQSQHDLANLWLSYVAKYAPEEWRTPIPHTAPPKDSPVGEIVEDAKQVGTNILKGAAAGASAAADAASRASGQAVTGAGLGGIFTGNAGLVLIALLVFLALRK